MRTIRFVRGVIDCSKMENQNLPKNCSLVVYKDGNGFKVGEIIKKKDDEIIVYPKSTENFIIFESTIVVGEGINEKEYKKNVQYHWDEGEQTWKNF